jgi:hypothetical protein
MFWTTQHHGNYTILYYYDTFQPIITAIIRLFLQSQKKKVCLGKGLLYKKWNIVINNLVIIQNSRILHVK